MDIPENFKKVIIKGPVDGNAIVIMGKVKRALKLQGESEAFIQSYATEAKSGDYDHLLQTSLQVAEFDF